MASPVVLGTGVAGLVCLALGGIVARKDVAAAHGLDKLTALACVFFAAPLAAFGAEHLTDASDIAQLIPAWMPARLFWAYFVGVALIAAGLSLSLKRYLRLTGALTALMFFLFVAMMHIPGVVASPRDRFSWAIAFRDLSFGSGALALAGAMTPRLVSGPRQCGDHRRQDLPRRGDDCLRRRALPASRLRARCAAGKDDSRLGAASAPVGLHHRSGSADRGRRHPDQPVYAGCRSSGRDL